MADKALYQQILAAASGHLASFAGQTLDVLDVARPSDLEYAIHLSKVISKLSPMLGNIIEYRVVAELNSNGGKVKGKWVRQDPGFPDTIFVSDVTPTPGIEVKTWFPLATEITARFKDSITHFSQDQTNVAMLAWLPDHMIYGKPRIIDVWVDSAKSVAEARDQHYHNPPDYLVFEPEDCSSRTRNLIQTNTNGYKFQGTAEQFKEAERIVASWGKDGKVFDCSSDYQTKIKQLLGRFPYRLDTNFAKMDRIEHTTLERFKSKVLSTHVNGYSVEEWARILANPEQPYSKGIIKSLIGL